MREGVRQLKMIDLLGVHAQTAQFDSNNYGIIEIHTQTLIGIV